MRYAALLRAVNLGPHNRVTMPGLCDLFSELGFEDVRTILQSGNVGFSGPPKARDRVERILEEGLLRRTGVDTEVLVRTAAEWTQVIRRNPFPRAAAEDPGHLIVQFLRTPPARGRESALREAVTGPEEVRALGDQLYVTYPEGIGRSKLTQQLIERTLGVTGTGRNWSTVGKVGATLLGLGPR